MSKKADKRARCRALQEQLPEVRRAYLLSQERRGREKTTPKSFERQALKEPFYLQELGLEPVLRGMSLEPKYEPGPVIRSFSSQSNV